MATDLMTFDTTWTIDDLAKAANDAAADAEAHANDAVVRAVECGRALCEVKSRLKHGQWESWLLDNFERSSVTAWRYMRLAGKFESDVPEVGSIRQALEYLNGPDEQVPNLSRVKDLDITETDEISLDTPDVEFLEADLDTPEETPPAVELITSPLDAQPRLKELVNAINAAIRHTEALPDAPGYELARGRSADIVQHFELAKGIVNNCTPTKICGRCKGKADGCATCANLGWV